MKLSILFVGIFSVLGSVSQTAEAVEPGGRAAVSNETNSSLREGSSDNIERSRSLDVRRSRGTEERSGLERRAGQSDSAEQTVEMNYANWLMQALAVHGRADVQDCVNKIAYHRGVRVNARDPWNKQPYIEPSVCALAVNEFGQQVGDRLSQSRAKELPAPESAAAGEIVSINSAEIDAAFLAATQSVNSGIGVDYARAHGLAWRAGPYFFSAESGAIFIQSQGRALFDAEHVGGMRRSFRIVASKNKSTANTSAIATTKNESRDSSISRKSAGTTTSSSEHSNSASSSVAGGK